MTWVMEIYPACRFRNANIDRLAAEGITFTDYYAGSTVCAPSVLLTGMHTAIGRGNGR